MAPVVAVMLPAWRLAQRPACRRRRVRDRVRVRARARARVRVRCLLAGGGEV